MVELKVKLYFCSACAQSDTREKCFHMAHVTVNPITQLPVYSNYRSLRKFGVRKIFFKK